jgi:hypothetical protein
VGVEDRGEHAQASAAVRAAFKVEVEDSAQELSPAQMARAAWGCRWRCRDGRGSSGRVGGCIEVGPIFGDEVAQAGASREHTVIADLVGARGRDQGGELAEEVERFEEQRLGAVAPGMRQAVEQASVGELGEAVGGERGAQDVAEETLEAAPVMCVDGDVGVEVEATGGGAARACAPLDVVGVDAIAEALEALAGARNERDATLDGGAVEGGERGVSLGERIVFEIIAAFKKAGIYQKGSSPTRSAVRSRPPCCCRELRSTW